MVRFLAVLLVVAGISSARDTVIVDTDSGLFGDDGAALVMLVRSPAQIAIQGITVVPGNVWAPQGAEYMLHILDLLKRSQLPVATGAEGPLIHTAAMSKEFDRRWGGLSYIGAFAQDPAAVIPAPGSKLSTRQARHDAVNFLISEIEKHPGEVTILALGPMTNIALALSLKPDIETKIKRIVFMGGNIRVAGNATPAAEFNFWFDPEAARIVLRSHPQEDDVGLDICNLAKIKANSTRLPLSIRPLRTSTAKIWASLPRLSEEADAAGHVDSLARPLLDPDYVSKSNPLPRCADHVGQFCGSTTPLDRRHPDRHARHRHARPGFQARLHSLQKLTYEDG